MGITEFDIATKRLLRANCVFCGQVGRSEADPLGQYTLSTLTHPDDRDGEASRFAAFRETGQSYETEPRYSLLSYLQRFPLDKVKISSPISAAPARAPLSSAP